MAHYIKKGNKYQFQICVNGVREARSFLTRKEGQVWAARRETELLARDTSGAVCGYTMTDLINKYIKEVAPRHRGWRAEIVRLTAFKKNRELPMDIPLTEILRPDIKAWRQVRLRQVSEASVQREMNLLSTVFEAARAEWEWIETNPVRGIKKLPTPAHRTSVWKYPEIKKILRALNYSPLAENPKNVTQSVALAFLLALRTGMRAGELCGLTWENTHDFHVVLPLTKNGSGRSVPLDYRARRIIAKARGLDETLVLGIRVDSLGTLFRRAKQKAGLEEVDLTFHDARHTAATWLARDLSMVDLCKMFGWKNPQYALIYYNPDPQGLANQLDSRRLLGANRSNLDQRFNDVRY